MVHQLHRRLLGDQYRQGSSRMIRRLSIGLVIALAIAAAIFRLTHTPIYGECRYTPDGRVCTLIGYK